MESEHRALTEAAGFFDRSAERARVVVTGGERVPFLQRLLSNDVESLGKGEAVMATLLTPKGKLIAEMTVVNAGDHFILEYPAALREEIFRKLDMYVLSSDVAVEDVTGTLAQVGLHGPGAGAALAAAGAGCLAVGADYLGVAGFDLFCPAGEKEALLAALAEQATPVSPAAAEVVRIEHGVPRFGAEMDGDLLPPEIPWLTERAISYTKGCFVGQETIARIKTYGHVNRELRGLVLAGDDVPEVGTAIVAGEKEVGRITSACVSPAHGAIALGLVKRQHLDPGTEVEVGGATATVVLPGEWA